MAIATLPRHQSDALHRLLERHGELVGEVVRMPPGVQVRVDYLERTAKGTVREGVARGIRPAFT